MPLGWCSCAAVRALCYAAAPLQECIRTRRLAADAALRERKLPASPSFPHLSALSPPQLGAVRRGRGGGAEGKRGPAGSCGFKGAAEPALPPRRRAPAGCPSPAPQPPPAALPVPRHRAGGVPQCPAHAAAPAPFCRVLVRSCLLIRA